MTSVRLANWRLRCLGLAVVASAAWYLPWSWRAMNDRALWLAFPYVLAGMLLVLTILVAVAANWRRASAVPDPAVETADLRVSVLVPTSGEPAETVRATIASILDQQWPADRLVIAVGDDAASPFLRQMVEVFSAEHPAATVVYYAPPAPGDPGRRGADTAGVLNAGLDLLRQRGLLGDVVEVRAADDLVGNPAFLAQGTAVLASDPNLAFVQTTRQATVSAGDPFANRDLPLYRGTMFAAHAANAVVPRGSGVLWSTRALDDIGDFPTWNLYEDLHSGVEALRRGWTSAYLPIVGGRAQAAPEDLPSLYRWRGARALDTLRFLLWGSQRGLGLRQRLQLAEAGLNYAQSVATASFLFVAIAGLWAGVAPLETGPAQFALHFVPVAVCIELVLAAYTRRGGVRAYWRARELSTGLLFVHLKALVQAFFGGPRGRPSPPVTRRFLGPGLYLRAVVPQLLVLAAAVAATVFAIRRGDALEQFAVGGCYWGAFSVLLLVAFVRRAWFGWSPRAALARRLLPAVVESGSAPRGPVVEGTEPVAGTAAMSGAGSPAVTLVRRSAMVSMGSPTVSSGPNHGEVL